MAETHLPLIADYDVATTSGTRANLTKILARFRAEGKKAKPILFGSHRKVEAVLVPAKVWEKLIDDIDDLQLAVTVLNRANNSQVTGPMNIEQFREYNEERLARFRELDDAKDPRDPGVPDGSGES